MVKVVIDPISLIMREVLVGKKIMYEGAMRTIQEANAHSRVGTVAIETEDGKTFTISMEEKHEWEIVNSISLVNPKHKKKKGKD